MAYFDFSGISTRPQGLDVITGVIGGSSVYLGPTSASKRDSDCLLLVRTIAGVRSLAADLQLLEQICMVTPTPGHYMAVADALSRGLTFDCLRFAGSDASGNKKSVKVVAAESLQASHLTVLSTKNKRAYINPPSSGERWTLNPATSFETSTGVPYFMLHEENVCASPAGFGIVCDLLTTGALCDGSAVVPLFDPSNHGTEAYALAKRLMQTLLITADLPCDLCQVWQRWPRFSPSFRSAATTWASSCLEELPPAAKTTIRQPTSSQTIMSDYTRDIASSLAKLPFVQGKGLVPIAFPFSGNSQAGQMILDGSKVYAKADDHLEDELEGLNFLVKTHYASRDRFQVPIALTSIAGTNAAIYPWLDLEPVAQSRLDELSSWLTSPPSIPEGLAFQLASQVLNLVMQRAEDMARTYTSTMAVREPDPNERAPRINRFFVNRLANDGLDRLQLLHPSIDCGGTTLAMCRVYDLALTVNGTTYPPLRHYFAKAKALFDRHDRQPHLVALGHGDLHLGNMLALRPGEPKSTLADTDPSLRAVTIDYGTFGWHSPWIDVAKPLFVDCFGPYFYADVLGIDLEAIGVVAFRKAPGGMVLDFAPLGQATRKGDAVGRAIMTVMVRHVLRDLVNSQPAYADGNLRLLSSALWCCALLARNFSHRPDVFWANVAIAVILDDELERSGVDGLLSDGLFSASVPPY